MLTFAKTIELQYAFRFVGSKSKDFEAELKTPSFCFNSKFGYTQMTRSRG